MSGQDVANNPLAILGIFWDSDHFILFSRGFCANQVWPGAYWYQGVFLTQRSVNPASVRILIEAASASRTVSFTDCIRFWALWTSISVACKERETLHYLSSQRRPFLQNQPKLGVGCRSPCLRPGSPYLSHHWEVRGSTKKNPKKPTPDYVLYPQPASSMYSCLLFKQASASGSHYSLYLECFSLVAQPSPPSDLRSEVTLVRHPLPTLL